MFPEEEGHIAHGPNGGESFVKKEPEAKQHVTDRGQIIEYRDGEHTLRENFERYHEENPDVYEKLVKLSYDLVHIGHKKYGIAGLFEVLRWKHAMKTSGETLKLNNNYKAFYARKIMTEHPVLDGFFETREQRSEH